MPDTDYKTLLYNLADDIEETKKRPARNPERAGELETLFDQWEAEVNATPEPLPMIHQ